MSDQTPSDKRPQRPSLLLRVDQVCARFEAAWLAARSAGQRPRIEDYLGANTEPERSELLRELLALELEYRRHQGEKPTLQEYQQRFPNHAKLVNAAFQEKAKSPSSRAQQAISSVPSRGSSGTVDRVPSTPAVRGSSPLPNLPGYEIQGELGRGAMGVVYKAHQASLKRTVALKMILSQQLADPADVRRFRTEAENVARLDHPHIVPIYEVSEHEGQHYFSMKLIEGKSLARELAHFRKNQRAAAHLLAQVARAVHHAHLRGILHRDLKPANILLDQRKQPHLTDFGLAKRIQSEGNLEASGAIVGTPAYMAPEQATAQKSVSTAADVYGLGAVLYALLTGRAPFQGDNVLEILQQVVEREPTPPRALNPAVDRDLETVCLKCLAKDPNRRYRSAEELAEDLDRWLQGEPILARAGRWERTAKWVRRNPLVASLLAAVFVVLLAGAGVSLGFAIHAANRAEEARTSEARAKRKEGEAVAAKEAQEKTSEKLANTLISSWVRSLRWQQGPLTDSEIEVLWEMAETQSESLGPRFAAVALHSPLTTGQLKTRAELALHAAIGLDPRKRAQAERFFAERLRDPGLDDGKRTDVALACATLGNLTPATTKPVAQALIRGLPQVHMTDRYTLRQLADGLGTAGARLESKDAALACAALIQAMARNVGPTDDSAHRKLFQALMVVASRLEGREADKAAAKLLEAIISYGPGADGSREPLAEGLAFVARRLEPKVAAALFQPMAEMSDYRLAKALAAVAGDLKPAEARKAAAIVSLANMPYQVHQLAQALAVFADRLEPNDAARFCAEASTILSQALAETTHAWSLQKLAQSLVAVSAHLDPRSAAQAAATLNRAMARTAHPDALPYLAQALVAVASRLEATEAARFCAEATATLAQARANSSFPSRANSSFNSKTFSLTEPLAALAALQEPKDTAQAAATLSQLIAKTANPRALSGLAEGLAVVADRLEPREAVRLCTQAATILSQSMSKMANPAALGRLAEMSSLADGLAVVAHRLEPREAGRLCNQAADTLLQAMAKTNDPVARQSGWRYAAQGLAAVAAHLEPKDAAAILSQAMANRESPLMTSDALVVLAGRLGPNEAAQASGTISQLMAETDNPYYLKSLARGLAVMARRLQPKDAGLAASTLTRAMVLAPDHRNLRQGLAEGLVAVADRLGPKDATQVADVFCNVMAKPIHPFELRDLAQALAVVAGRLELKEAAHFCAGPAATICQAMANPSMHYSFALPHSQALAALATWLDTNDAAATLFQAMANTTDPAALRVLGRGLAAILTRVDPPESSKRAAAVVTIIGRAASTCLPIGTPVLLHPALEPLPCRSSTPQLVELLKYPTCVGSARRVILDELETRYRRKFADHWAFVRFAEEQKLDLDFTTPPKRPGLPASGKSK
jgi:serine/threonine-protein kinase